MTEYRVTIEGEMLADLERTLAEDEIVGYEDGRPIFKIEKVLVDRVGSTKLEIFSDEHPPPHFCVTYQGSSANYCISGFHRQNGNGQVLRKEKKIREWWKRNKKKLIDVWNRRRPADCPVGPYREGCNCENG